jgi:nucleotide-binding universal stress UspA family protein
MDAQHIRRTVVVGVDGSTSALRAVRWGAAEATRRRATLRLVSAFAWMVHHVAARPGIEDSYRDTLLARAREQLAEAGRVAEAEGAGIEIELQLIEGSPMQVLGSEADRAQLLVLGDRGLTRVEGLLVGSVAVGLAAHAACPVVVVRGDERSPSETASLPVLVGVDGSSTSDAAVGFAFEAAAARKVPLVALHTWSDMMFDPSFAGVVVDWDVVESAERRVLSKRVGGWTEKFPDTSVELVVRRDQPAPSLLALAAGAQLVVVGSRGHGEFVGMVLGSVSHALVHRAPCPVAVVRTETAERPA